MNPIVDPALTDPETVLGALDFAGVAVFAATGALAAAQQIDQRAPEQKAKDQRREKSGTRAKGDVAEKVEKITPIRKLGKPEQHSVNSLMILGDRLPEFAQGVNDQ